MGLLLLGITLIVWAASLLGWVAVSGTVLGILALITGIVLLLQNFGVINVAIPTIRRTPPAA